jgi:hypothetical protein
MGSDFIDRTLMLYTYFDSGPAVQETVNHLTQIFGTEYASELAINMRVRNAYADVLAAKTHEDLHKNLDTLEGALQKAVEYNPHDLLKAHADHRRVATKRWVEGLDYKQMHAFLSDSEKTQWSSDGSKNSIGDVVKVVGKRVVTVEQMIKESVKKCKDPKNLVHRINWAEGLKGLSGEQRDIVRETLRIFSGKPKGGDEAIGLSQFVDLMHNMSGHVGGKDQIAAMMKENYWDFGYQTQGTYDCWLDIAETPPELAKENVKHKLSSKFGRKGRGAGDLLIRAWGDAGVGLEAQKAIFEAVTTMDINTYLKAIHEVQRLTRGIYGSPWDGRTAMYLTAGLFEQASQDALHEFTFGLAHAVLPKSSPLRRLISEHAESWSVEERYEKLGQLENILMASLHDYDHEVATAFMEYIGLNFPGGFDKSKLWAKRFYGLAAIAVILIAVEAAKEGTEELTGSFSGGGGGRGH